MRQRREVDEHLGGGDHRRRGDDGGAAATAATATTAKPATTGGVGDHRRGRTSQQRARRPAARRQPRAEQVDPGSKSPPPAGVGLIDGVYKGTSGFEIDPKNCPSDWDPKQGITDTEIHLFDSLPTSGPLAGFGLLADGAKAYFKYINDNGGIEGRQIILDTKDDGYKPDQTKTNVDEALGSKKYASLFVTLGTPNNLAVWDETNDECMPQLLNGTGAAQWGDVENHPWTSGMQLDYFTAASLWATWLQKEHPDKTKVAELTFNSDFGQSYHNGFAYAIKGTADPGGRSRGPRADRAEPGQPVHDARRERRRRAAAGDLRGVLHPGDGRRSRSRRRGSRS